MSATQHTGRPFAAFEWMIALRYLRARRKEGFISVIAGFSFLGIMLGVATLIIVLSVMNGFRNELFDGRCGSCRGRNRDPALSPPCGDRRRSAAFSARSPR